jgi:c-di-GMP-binding flagellar brake protein YcgR
LIRDDQRRFPRVPTKFRVEYTVGDKTARGRASTLGGGGLFLLSPAVLSPDTEVVLRFRPSKHMPLIEAKGKVRYALPGKGSGVEFTQLSEENFHLILRLIHHKLANRRRYSRAPLATQVYCRECMSLAFSRDASLGGMFIETHNPLPVGSQVSLRFHLNDGGPIVVTAAEVKYSVQELGMGVEFVELSPTDRKRIAAHIASAAKPSGPPNSDPRP